jgi:hypothetical protein
MSEVFGYDTASITTEEQRKSKWCPFRESACTKQGKRDPLGICSYSDGSVATVVCPVRFLEDSRLIRDAGREAFGAGASIVSLPEFRLLTVERPNQRPKKIGKVDFLIGLIGPGGNATDFAALEIQSSYVSGTEIRTAFHKFQDTGTLTNDTRRRPDFRSSAQKRLMPQLSLKVPVFRRWGKRFFVAVDSTLFDTLPRMESRRSDEAEITWLVYRFARSAESGYAMSDVRTVHTHWADVETALREGTSPEKDEVLNVLTRCASKSVIFET